MKKKLLAALVVVLLIGGGFWYASKHDTKPVTVEHLSKDQAPQEPVPTEKELKDKFDTLIAETANTLPTLDRIKKLEAEDVHQTPEVINKAGRALGKILTFRLDHPQFAQEALEFYKSCALSVQVATSVRALCLYNVLDIDKKAELKEYPESVVKLMKKLR